MIKSKVGKMLNVKIDDITYLQGDLKELSVENFEKLKKSIINHGLISPGFVWRHKNKIYALDCHQRLKTLKQMRAEGFQVPEEIPAVEILADNMQQAKRYLLQYVSQHGKITDDGLYEFIHNADFEGSIDDLCSELSLDGINLDEFKDAFFEDCESEDGEAAAGEDSSREGSEGNAEKFTFIVNKKDAETIHKALKKAEGKTGCPDGAEQLIEICKAYLKK